MWRHRAFPPPQKLTAWAAKRTSDSPRATSSACTRCTRSCPAVRESTRRSPPTCSTTSWSACRWTTRLAFRTSCRISCRTVALGPATERTRCCRPEAGARRAASPLRCLHHLPAPPAMIFALTWMTRTRSTATSRWKRRACQLCPTPSPCGDRGRQKLLEMFAFMQSLVSTLICHLKRWFKYDYLV